MTSNFLPTTSAPAQRLALAACLWVAAAGVHAADASCISAGRLDAEGRWAPQFQGVRLLDEAGRALPTRTRADLSRVRGVELTQPALLSTGEGNRALTRGDDAAGDKAQVAAATPGRRAAQGAGLNQAATRGEGGESRV